MAIKQDWGKSNLRDYLLYDVWSLHGAFRVLAGLNYYGPGDEPQDEFDPDYSLDGSVGVHGNETEAKALDSLPDMREMWAIFDRLEFFWQNGRHDDNKDSPADFIKWAITKGHRPEWLDWALSSEHRPDWRDWATKHDLSTLKQGAEKTESTRNLNISDKLAYLNQASDKFWAHADKADRDTHANNNDVEAWLIEHGYSQTLAAKAATIIRPEWAITGRKPEK